MRRFSAATKSQSANHNDDGPARLVRALSARAIRRLVDVLSNELAHRRIEIATDIASEVAWRTAAGIAADVSHTEPIEAGGLPATEPKLRQPGEMLHRAGLLCEKESKSMV